MDKTNRLIEFQKWIRTLEAHDIERLLCNAFWKDHMEDSELLRAFLLHERGVDMRITIVDGVHRTATFEIKYDYFEPGTYVAPQSARFSLPLGIYKVHAYKEPSSVGGEAIVFVEYISGVKRTAGMWRPARHFRKATEIEMAYGLAEARDRGE